MIRQKRIGFSVFVLIAVTFWMMGYSLVMTERTLETARTALRLFAHSVLPSLILFSVCSKLLIKLGMAKKLAYLPLGGLLKPLGMSAGGFSAFLIGSFAGFPTGAVMLADLYERGEISEREAESLLPFCNQAGIAFLLGTVGGAMLKDIRMGMIFFFAQTLTAWICVCITAYERRGCESVREVQDSSEPSLISAVTSSVRESAFSMMGVCGFVVFFALAGTVLFDTLFAIGLPLGNTLRSFIAGMLEISLGFRMLADGDCSQLYQALLGGVFLGLGGCSVFLQAMEKTEMFFFSPRKYFRGKLLSAIFCPIVTVLLLYLYDKTNGKNLIIVLIAFIFCSFYFFNCVKIKFFSKKCGKMKRNAV